MKKVKLKWFKRLSNNKDKNLESNVLNKEKNKLQNT